MNVEDIRNLSQSLGIKPGRLTKRELIRAIQRVEGNFDCYGTAYDGVCDQLECLWRRDCFREAKRYAQT